MYRFDRGLVQLNALVYLLFLAFEVIIVVLLFILLLFVCDNLCFKYKRCYLLFIFP